MKNKFNWNRFYDELDEADPKKFPYWMWMAHEISNMVAALATGFVMAFVFLFAMGVVLGVLAHEYPAWTFLQFKNAICQAP